MDPLTITALTAGTGILFGVAGIIATKPIFDRYRKRLRGERHDTHNATQIGPALMVAVPIVAVALIYLSVILKEAVRAGQ